MCSRNAVETRRYRTIWISDMHLGTRGCKVQQLLDFRKYNESETLYFVGDIVDGWRLRKSWYWLQPHNDLVQKVLRRARKGCRVIYVPGNHDELFRRYSDLQLGGIEVMAEAIHTTVYGRRSLIFHGDQFDGVVRYAKWLALVGGGTYVAVLRFNHWFNLARRGPAYPYGSLSSYLKNWVKNAVEFISNFERAVAEEARRRGVDECGMRAHSSSGEEFGSLFVASAVRVDGAGGSQASDLNRRYPEAHFLGEKTGEDLALIYSAADVFVFPSRTDTFGLVLLEAMASGVPVAAYPVPGPLDVMDVSGAGVLDEDLDSAIRKALTISPRTARAHALTFSWRRSAEQFLKNLTPFA